MLLFSKYAWNNQHFFGTHAPLRLFQNIFNKGLEITSRKILLMCYYDRRDVLEWVGETYLDIFKNLDTLSQLQLGNHLAQNHKLELCQEFLKREIVTRPLNLVGAILNRQKLDEDKQAYLSFIKFLLDQGLDPNYLVRAKSTQCVELMELLLYMELDRFKSPSGTFLGQ